MNIIIQSLGFKSSESLEIFIREKISNIKDDKIIRANVILFKGPASNPENDYCEIRLEVPGNDHFVKKHSAHFEVAITECVDILTQMLTKAKEKKSLHSETEIPVEEENVSMADDLDD
ncbi:MAG: HPF/RaiA family ribosome-associated protein [Ferruginibacter sp.]